MHAGSLHSTEAGLQQLRGEVERVQASLTHRLQTLGVSSTTAQDVAADLRERLGTLKARACEALLVWADDPTNENARITAKQLHGLLANARCAGSTSEGMHHVRGDHSGYCCVCEAVLGVCWYAQQDRSGACQRACCLACRSRLGNDGTPGGVYHDLQVTEHQTMCSIVAEAGKESAVPLGSQSVAHFTASGVPLRVDAAPALPPYFAVECEVPVLREAAKHEYDSELEPDAFARAAQVQTGEYNQFTPPSESAIEAAGDSCLPSSIPQLCRVLDALVETHGGCANPPGVRDRGKINLALVTEKGFEHNEPMQAWAEKTQAAQTRRLLKAQDEQVVKELEAICKQLQDFSRCGSSQKRKRAGVFWRKMYLAFRESGAFGISIVGEGGTADLTAIHAQQCQNVRTRASRFLVSQCFLRWVLWTCELVRTTRTPT